MSFPLIEKVTCKACGDSWEREVYEELRPVDASIGWCPSCGEDGECEEVAAIDDGMKQCPFEKACRCVMDEPCEYCETKCEYDKLRRRETIEECKTAVANALISGESPLEAVVRIVQKEE